MRDVERLLVRSLTAVFYGITVFVLVGMIFWFYPRKIIRSATPMKTDKTTYSRGERVTVSGETWTNTNSPATFDVRLICNNTKYPYDYIELNVSEQDVPVKYSFPYKEIPDFIPQSECRIETTANYTVQVLPLLTRNYQYIFTSNNFNVKE